MGRFGEEKLGGLARSMGRFVEKYGEVLRGQVWDGLENRRGGEAGEGLERSMGRLGEKYGKVWREVWAEGLERMRSHGAVGRGEVGRFWRGEV